MADETTTTTTADAAGGDKARNSGNGGKQDAAPITFATEEAFQAKVEVMLKERLERERKRADDATAKAKADAERKAAEEAGEFKKLYEGTVAKLQEAEQRATAASLAVTRRDIAAKLNVPSALADRLRGDTPEDIEADAKQLLAQLPKATLSANAGSGSRQPGASDGQSMNAFIRAAAGRTQ